MTHLIVVGAGLSGLFAAALAAQQGFEVTLIAEGRGGLPHSHGCIDVWGSGVPARSLHWLPSHHPYRLAGYDALRSALGIFAKTVTRAGIAYTGSLASNLVLPTAMGGAHVTSLAPLSMAAGDLTDQTAFNLGRFEGFRDWFPKLTAAHLRRHGYPVDEVISLPLPEPILDPNRYSTDLARRFDDPTWRKEVALGWKPLLAGVKRLGLPAVLGLKHPDEAISELSDRIGVALFEIPTLPPSVPGIRLERLLRRSALEDGVHLIEGPHVIGRVDGRSAGKRVSGVVAYTPSRPTAYDAECILLATGGVLNGGLVALQNGRVRESVFDLPVVHTEGRQQWTNRSLIERQPYARFGVLVDENMRPRSADGSVLFENLFAVGGLLANSDRTFEGSRQGIGLSTAYRAIQAVTQSLA